MTNKKKKAVKKLNGIETMQKFVKDLQAVKDTDYSKIIPLTQITWRETAHKNNIIATLEVTKEKISNGNVGIRLKKALSDNCLIIELRTNTGIYSSKVICETGAYKPDAKGTWGVNPLSFHKM